MRITVIGATGGVGRQLVAQAVAAGHVLTAVVRDPARLAPDVRAVRADLAEPSGRALEDAVLGADAVLSCLGARSSQDIGVACRGTSALIGAMEASGTRRLVVISAAPVATVPSPARPDPPRDPGDSFLVAHLLGPVIKRVFRRAYDDLARMEDIVRVSSLDWTILRPPRLTDRPDPTAYRLAYGHNVKGGFAVSRPAVAHAMLTLIADPAALRQTVGIAK